MRFQIYLESGNPLSTIADKLTKFSVKMITPEMSEILINSLIELTVLVDTLGCSINIEAGDYARGVASMPYIMVCDFEEEESE